MQHGFEDNDDYHHLVTSSAIVVSVHWRELARREAQRLLRLSEESKRYATEWKEERAVFEALKVEVQAELRREARQQAKFGGGGGLCLSLSSASGSPQGGGGGGDEVRLEEAGPDAAALEEKLNRLRQQQRREQAKARNLRRERAALEAELDRRQVLIADLQDRLGQIRRVV